MITTTKKQLKLRKSARGPYSTNSPAIAAAVAAYLATPAEQQIHGVKKSLCQRYRITPQSFSSALTRAKSQAKLQ